MPLDIRFFVGRREIIRSLGTHDLSVPVDMVEAVHEVRYTTGFENVW